MKNNKIILALNEKVFLEFCKTLEIKDIKTNEDIIIAQKERENSEWETETLVVIHWKDKQKTLDYITSIFIYIEKIILVNSAKVLSNWEFTTGDVLIPNTFISSYPQSLSDKEGRKTFFIENTIWEDYDFKTFWLILNGICADIPLLTKEVENSDEFVADICSEWIYMYLQILQQEKLFEKTNVITQIGEENYMNLIAVSEMSL